LLNQSKTAGLPPYLLATSCGEAHKMTEQNSTPTNPENQDTSIKTALNLRWKYFKSLHGDILAAQFDSDSLSANPHFVPIDRQTYLALAERFQS